MGHNILAVVAHGDDEVLGCGGTLRLHSNMGDDVYIYIIADGESSRIAESNMEERISNREKAIKKVARILGAKEVFIDRLPDNRLDSLDRIEIIKKVERYICKLKPAIVYTHHAGDLNIDHRRVHEAVITATRPQDRDKVNTILFFETPSSTEWQPPSSHSPFNPNWFVDITDTVEAKFAALKIYDAEMREWPHPRSYAGVEALMKWRGVSVGTEAAEAFILGRHIA